MAQREYLDDIAPKETGNVFRLTSFLDVKTNLLKLICFEMCQVVLPLVIEEKALQRQHTLPPPIKIWQR